MSFPLPDIDDEDIEGKMIARTVEQGGVVYVKLLKDGGGKIVGHDFVPPTDLIEYNADLKASGVGHMAVKFTKKAESP